MTDWKVYVHFRVRNTLLTSKGPREPGKSRRLDTAVIRSFSRYRLRACRVPGRRAGQQGLRGSHGRPGPHRSGLGSRGFSHVIPEA